jgi:hypothetical protein
MLLSNDAGGYAFLRGIGPYSAGVAAAPGFTIEHVRLADPVPLQPRPNPHAPARFGQLVFVR